MPFWPRPLHNLANRLRHEPKWPETIPSPFIQHTTTPKPFYRKKCCRARRIWLYPSLQNSFSLCQKKTNLKPGTSFSLRKCQRNITWQFTLYIQKNCEIKRTLITLFWEQPYGFIYLCLSAIPPLAIYATSSAFGNVDCSSLPLLFLDKCPPYNSVSAFQPPPPSQWAPQNPPQ